MNNKTQFAQELFYHAAKNHTREHNQPMICPLCDLFVQVNGEVDKADSGQSDIEAMLQRMNTLLGDCEAVAKEQIGRLLQRGEKKAVH